MAVQNFSVPEGNCAAGVKTTSPSTVISSNPQSVMIRLTSSEWAAKAGTGNLRWGVERSPDGVAWEEWMFQPGVGGAPLPIGTLGGKDGLLPSMTLTGGAMTSLVGYRVRLFAVPTVAIQLGANVTVTS